MFCSTTQVLTPQAASNAGLPIHIGCTQCHAPSRGLDIQALVKAGKANLDIEAAAKRGAFRCTSCGARKAVVVPLMADLVRRQCRLHRRCLKCGHDRQLTAVEAVMRYGFATPLDELRERERRKCRIADCALSIGFTRTADVLRKEQFGVSPSATGFRFRR